MHASSGMRHVLTARALLQTQFRSAHALLDSALDISGASTRRTTAGAGYAHAVFCEDVTVNGVLGAGMPLALSRWAGRTGCSSLPRPEEMKNWRDWGRVTQVDLIVLRPYASAVHDSTDEYLRDLPDAVLDASSGDMTSVALSALLLMLARRYGEICCLHAGEDTESIVMP